MRTEVLPTEHQYAQIKAWWKEETEKNHRVSVDIKVDASGDCRIWLYSYDLQEGMGIDKDNVEEFTSAEDIRQEFSRCCREKIQRQMSALAEKAKEMEKTAAAAAVC